MTNERAARRISKVPQDAPEGFVGSVNVALELPGCPETNYKYTLPDKPITYIFVQRGVVQNGSEVFVVTSPKGTFRYYADCPRLTDAEVKRCNTISQTKNDSVNPAVNNQAFIQTGTAVYGAARSNVTVYNEVNPSGLPMTNATSTEYTFPVPPTFPSKPGTPKYPAYIYFHHGTDYYENESNIDMSLEPLPDTLPQCSYP